ncbi:MAG: signal peptide protein [Verrucomicrobia bacterium]|nr:MAG: signal peptide protein [Verrucomicrobiota bacterium]
MTTKIFALIALVGFAGVCVAQAQSPSPAKSPSPSPTPAKHRAAKKAQATAAAHPTPSPSPGKFNLGDLFKPKTSASTGAAVTPVPASGASTQAASKVPAPGGGHGLVWVNAETKVYHREGSRFYGTTKKGKYMTEAEAIKEGDKAAAKGL